MRAGYPKFPSGKYRSGSCGGKPGQTVGISHPKLLTPPQFPSFILSHIANVIICMAKINSLFEHDAAMRYQAENSTLQPCNFANQALEQQTGLAEPWGSNMNTTKLRHRASVACASCRDRRIRVSISILLALSPGTNSVKCVVPQGERACAQCSASGIECIIKNDDERRR